MNVPLNAVVEGVSSGLFKGPHRLIAFTADQAALMIRVFPATQAPFEVDYPQLCDEVTAERVREVGYVPPRGQPSSQEQIRNPEDRRYKRNIGFLEQIVPENDYEGRWMHPDLLEGSISRTASQAGIDRQSVAHVVYRYLAGGCSLLAAVPRFRTGGGSRKLQSKGAKRGRKYDPGNAKSVLASYNLPSIEETRSKLQQGVKEFYNPKLKNFSEAYDLTLDRYFSTTRKGKRTRNLLLPSKKQFRTEIDRLNKNKQLVANASGPREHGRNHRGLADRRANSIPGPTFVHEIDATFPQLDVVAEFDRSVVLGPLTVYAVIDAWDGVLVGTHPSHRPACLSVARSAVYYAWTDKYSQYDADGIPLGPGEDECDHVCHQFTSDRGELRGSEGDVWVRSLGMRAVTVLAERADLKGTVEEINAALEAEGLKRAPGFRGVEGQEKRPGLTMKEVRRALKRIRTKLNLRAARQVPLGVKLPQSMKFTRMDHHKWGLKNIRGAGRRYDKAALYLRLLPRYPCTMTREGVLWEKLPFSSLSLANSGLLDIAESNKFKSGFVRVDADDISRIWLEHGDDFIEMSCLDKRVQTAKMSVDESLAMLKRDGHVRTATALATQQRRSGLAAANNQMFQDAAHSAAMASSSKPKSTAAATKRKNKRDAGEIEKAEQVRDKQADAGLIPSADKSGAPQTAASLLEAMLEKRRRSLAKELSTV